MFNEEKGCGAPNIALDLRSGYQRSMGLGALDLILGYKCSMEKRGCGTPNIAI